MSGSVSTLRKLARFYKTNILDFYDAGAANSRQVRPAERKVLEAGAGVRMELLAWGNTVMEPHLFRIAPEAGSGDPYTHEGEEFIYVLRGELAIAVESKEWVKAFDAQKKLVDTFGEVVASLGDPLTADVFSDGASRSMPQWNKAIVAARDAHRSAQFGAEEDAKWDQLDAKLDAIKRKQFEWVRARSGAK